MLLVVAFAQITLLLVGAVFAAAGIALYAHSRLKRGGESGEGVNRIEVFKIKAEVSAPSLIIVVLGCGMMLSAVMFLDGAGGGGGDGGSDDMRLQDASPSPLPTLTQTIVVQQEPVTGFTGERFLRRVSSAGPTAYDRFVDIQDDTAALTVTVPAVWTEQDGTAWEHDGEEVGPGLSAARDHDAFYSTWGEPGMFFGASSILAARGATVDSLLDAPALDEVYGHRTDCTFEERGDYDDGLYAGRYETWADCGGTETGAALVAARPADGTFLLFVYIQLTTTADLDALERIIESFVVTARFQQVWAPLSAEFAGGDRVVYDDSHTLRVAVPRGWSDTVGEPWEFDGQVIGPLVAAGPNLAGILESWAGEGVIVGASSVLVDAGYTPDLLLDEDVFGTADACVFEGREDYDDGVHVGRVEFWSGCGDASTMVVVAATPRDGSVLLLAGVQLLDLAPLDSIAFETLAGFHARW